MTAVSTPRVIGIVRVSSTRDRDAMSPDQQRERIRQACKDRGWKLVDTVEELDVSGGKPLAKRHGLRSAIEAIEHGQANILAGVYLDRLVRSLKVQHEMVERVEKANGQVFALDTGQLSSASAGQWLSGTMLGAVAEYHRLTTAERVRDSHIDALAEGRPPYPFSTPGYILGTDGRVHVDTDTAPAVTEAFHMRATGATIATVRAHLQGAGIDISYRATQTLLRSRVVRGELRFGQHEPNLRSHDHIVEEDIWQAVQRARVPQGRKAKSDRLLARLGILFCSSCGRPMVAGSSVADGKRYENYRCSMAKTGDCLDPQTISARIVEPLARKHAERIANDAEGRASATSEYDRAVTKRDAAQERLDNAMRKLAGLEDEPVAQETLDSLKAERNHWKQRASDLAPLGATERTTLADWDAPDVTLEDRRVFVRSTIASMVVWPGRGASRVEVEPLGQATPRYAI